MNQNPTIAALKARLESEKNKTADENWNTHSGKLVPAALGWIEKDLIKIGHEAATARLLPLLEKAVENIEKLVHKLESSNRYDESCGVTNLEESEPEKQRYDIHKEATKKAREFLTTLADASGDMNKEGCDDYNNRAF